MSADSPKRGAHKTAVVKTAQTKPPSHKWRFPSKIRPNAFGWKSSRLAVDRLREAVGEITQVAGYDILLAAEGAVRLIERLSPALEQVDSSSGALGSAVNGAIETLVPILATAPAPRMVRENWLERLFAAHEADEIPYIETLTDYWGELCVTKEVADAWADRLIGITRMALSPDRSLRGHFHGTTACLDALLRAQRYAEIHDILKEEKFWSYKRWSVKALAAKGKADEAIALAEASRGPWTSEGDVNQLCERILLDLGRTDDAYRRYGLHAHRRGTHLATLRAIAKAYPSIPREQILTDLIALSPGEEGKWFASAKELKLYPLALELARKSPCDPKTLTRAARDYLEREPRFANEVGYAALYWLVCGHGYEITSIDVWNAYHATLNAAERLGDVAVTRHTVRMLVTHEALGGFVRQVLGKELGLP